jgi:hypothetical protein
MSHRTITGAGLAAALVAVVVAGNAHVDQPIVPTFSGVRSVNIPIMAQVDGITTSWFCPGVPLSIEPAIGGTVHVVSISDTEIRGRITVYADGAAPVEQTFELPARQAEQFDLESLQPQGRFASAMVELDAPGAVVEQQVLHPAGNPVSPCANAPQSQWYFADGFTEANSDAFLVITNPYPDQAVVTVDFATPDELLSTSALQGVPVAGRSLVVVDKALMPKSDTVFATKVTASRGRVVVGRAQQYLGQGRLGYTLSLGSPVLSDQWYFADGEKADGVIERYSIYNPNDEPIAVTPVFLGLESFFDEVVVEIPGGRVGIFVVDDVADLPEGRHALAFSADGKSFMVERAITRPAGQAVSTSVVLGMPGTNSVIANRWTIGIGVDQPLENALVVFNLAFQDGTVTVNAQVAGALAPVPGLEDLPIGANSIITVPLTDALAVGAPLVVVSDRGIVVERLWARGDQLRGRTGSMAVPG